MFDFLALFHDYHIMYVISGIKEPSRSVLEGWL